MKLKCENCGYTETTKSKAARGCPKCNIPLVAAKEAKPEKAEKKETKKKQTKKKK